MKYSIITCAYSNGEQFNNFAYTAVMQDFGDYEVVVVDNATPTNEIKDVCKKWSQIKYLRINPEEKKCTNITQGLNLAAKESSGEYLVIIADSNVLLSYNLLSEIDKIENKTWKVIISGQGTDIKISPSGKMRDEYDSGNQGDMAGINSELLKEMGWPDDPMKLRLIDGKHRFPPPHNAFDIYMVCMNRTIFLDAPYNESGTWGDYHSKFITNKCKKYNWHRLNNIRIIHQYHRVWKDVSADG